MRTKWECSECGHVVERHTAPVHCDECGTIGTFVAAAVNGDDEALEPGAAWFYAGMTRARLTSESASRRLD